MIHQCNIVIDGETNSFPVEGEFSWGKDETLFSLQDNLISKTSWHKKGYTVIPAFSQEEFNAAKASITKNILNVLRDKNVAADESSFTLEHYHKLVTDKDKHNEIINVTREFKNEDFTFDIDKLKEKISAILGYKLSSYNKELGRSLIQVRLSRPESYDINPPHRDAYLSFYSNIINLWIPIAGCNEKSSLPILPGSHLLNEKDIYRTENKGAKINGNVYNVPCILETKEGVINMVRPNPKETEALVFTPFLIHGAAMNRNKDITRVALELRFVKA